MRFSAILVAVFLVACSGAHKEEKAANAVVAVAYQAALEACLLEGLAVKESTKDGLRGHAAYEACASTADKKYGNK